MTLKETAETHLASPASADSEPGPAVTPAVGTAGAILAKEAPQHGHLEQGRAAAGALTGGKRDHFRS